MKSIWLVKNPTVAFVGFKLLQYVAVSVILPTLCTYLNFVSLHITESYNIVLTCNGGREKSQE